MDANVRRLIHQFVTMKYNQQVAERTVLQIDGAHWLAYYQFAHKYRTGSDPNFSAPETQDPGYDSIHALGWVLDQVLENKL